MNLIYIKKKFYLPKIWNALSPPENSSNIKKKKKKRFNFTFCSFNNFQKISDRTINVWSKILKNEIKNFTKKILYWNFRRFKK